MTQPESATSAGTDVTVPGEETATDEATPRTCPPPADFRKAVADYDAHATIGVWEGPRYRMTYRLLGQGPPLILIPGIASTYRSYALTLNTLAMKFRTIVYDYPGDHADDGAHLARINHEDLVSDVFGLIDHLRIGRVYLLGLSFGSTVTLATLHREPRRFPKAVIQGGFAHRNLSRAERVALWFGRKLPGQLRSIPFREAVLTYNSKASFPDPVADRWPYYLEQNGQTPIAGISHRLGLLPRVDLRPRLAEIPTEILLLHGSDDRIVSRPFFEELRQGLPKSTGVTMPLVGHQPHFTHGEGLAQTVIDWCLPCAPEGCPNEPRG